jgi:hypothetical protein
MSGLNRRTGCADEEISLTTARWGINDRGGGLRESRSNTAVLKPSEIADATAA